MTRPSAVFASADSRSPEAPRRVGFAHTEPVADDDVLAGIRRRVRDTV